MKKLILLITVTVLLVGSVRGILAAKEKVERYPCSFRNEHGKLVSLTDAQKARTKSVKLGKGMGVSRNEVTQHNAVATIRCVATYYGMDPDSFVSVATCESHHDPEAYNPGGPYHGMYQYLPETWAASAAIYGHKGASPHDGYASIHVTVQKVKAEGWGAWGICI